MGKTVRGRRDGTGLHRSSFVRKSGAAVGRRQAAGKPCPKKK